MDMYTLMCGDVIEQLSLIPSGTINTVITSPPYYGLRDYGDSHQIGLEKNPSEYIDKLVSVFREVKRVLRDDGVLWVNIGDSYSSSKSVGGCKPKDLIGVPWTLAFALRSDGWYLRQDVIWAKNNPMPESVRDRCTRSHEYIFMLTKNRKYYFDNKAIQEPCVTHDEYTRDRDNTKLNNTAGRSKMGGLTRNNYTYRNKRDVWSVPVGMFKGAHFAVFPEELIKPCVVSSCPVGGVVLDVFSGSGTTGVVAVKNDRRYIGIELNQQYIDISRERLNEVLNRQER